MVRRYGIVGYNGTRRLKRPKPIQPKLVKEEPAIVVEETVEVVVVKEEVPEVIEPEVFEKICESVVEAGEMTAEEANADCWDCMMSKECCVCDEICKVCRDPKEYCNCEKNPVEETQEEFTKLWVEEKPKSKKKRKYKKRKNASTVTSSSAPEVLVPPVLDSPEDPSTD